MGETSPEVPQPDAVPFQVEAELILQLGGSAVQRRGGPSRPPAPGPASWWSVRVMKNGADLGLRQTRVTHPLFHVVETPDNLRCPACSAVHLPLAWAVLGLVPSLWPLVSALQRLQGSPPVYKGLGCCP